MKAVLFTLVLAASLSHAALTTFTSLADWQAAAGGPVGIQSYTGAPSAFVTGGTAPQSVSGGALHVFLLTPGEVTFSLAGGFSAFVLNLDTTPAGPGSGVVLKADGVTFATVGLSGIFNGWVGFTSTQVVQQVSLSTQSLGNGLLWEHLDDKENQWVAFGGGEIGTQSAVTPEPGAHHLLLAGIGMILFYRKLQKLRRHK